MGQHRIAVIPGDGIGQEVVAAGIEVLQASCNGYYRTASGRIVTQWPHNFAEYSRRVDRDSLASFESGTVGA